MCVHKLCVQVFWGQSCNLNLMIFNESKDNVNINSTYSISVTKIYLFQFLTALELVSVGSSDIQRLSAAHADHLRLQSPVLPPNGHFRVRVDARHPTRFDLLLHRCIPLLHLLRVSYFKASQLRHSFYGVNFNQRQGFEVFLAFLEVQQQKCNTEHSKKT